MTSGESNPKFRMTSASLQPPAASCRFDGQICMTDETMYRSGQQPSLVLIRLTARARPPPRSGTTASRVIEARQSKRDKGDAKLLLIVPLISIGTLAMVALARTLHLLSKSSYTSTLDITRNLPISARLFSTSTIKMGKEDIITAYKVCLPAVDV
jgi:hypothetical protein